MTLDEFDVVLFDLDGTVYYGSKIIPGANESIKYFRNAGKKIYFATNNSTKTRTQIFEKLSCMGVDCSLEEIFTSGYIAALYAKKNNLKDFYIFGSKNLVLEFNEQGISISKSENAENLLIGYDPAVTYDDLCSALQVALRAKRIIACNKDRTFPGENSKLMPGCGAMAASIEWCANRKCDVIIGKPETFMVETLCRMINKNPDRLLVVGDSYETDIAMAKKAGCKSILISKNKIPVSELKETCILNSIACLPEIFSM
ncbi:MAG: HAD-IIA family hydrolase [Treponemataceae bacterium]